MPGQLEGDEPAGLAVDADGNVYVTGPARKATSLPYDYTTIKYDAEGTQLWFRHYDGGSSDEPRALTLDDAGNVYVTGASWAVNDPYSDFATVKYDREGNQLWVRRYDRDGLGDNPWAIAVNGASNVYVTGPTMYGGNGQGSTIIKYPQTLTPEELMAHAIAFYEEGLDGGTLYGVGQNQGGRSAANERHFRRLLDTIQDLIKAGDDLAACDELDKGLQRIDGMTPVPDLITGPDSPVLYDMLVAVRDALACGVGP